MCVLGNVSTLLMNSCFRSHSEYVVLEVEFHLSILLEHCKMCEEPFHKLAMAGITRAAFQ